MKKITTLLLISLMLFVACESEEDQLAEAIELLKGENYTGAETIFHELRQEVNTDSSVGQSVAYGSKYISLVEEVDTLRETDIFTIEALKDLFKNYADYLAINERYSNNKIKTLFTTKLDEYRSIVDISIDDKLSLCGSREELEELSALFASTVPPYPHQTQSDNTGSVLKETQGVFLVTSENNGVKVDADKLRSAIELLSNWSELEDLITDKLTALASNLSKQEDYQDAIRTYQAVYKLTEEQSLLARIEKLEEKYEKQKAREERERIISQQKSYTSGVEVAVAIGSAKLQKYLGNYYSYGNARYLLVHISVKNVGNDRHHANPHDFTVADQWGNTCGYDTSSFSLNNYFDSTDLNPGNQTSGWLAFLVNKDSEYYTLYCDDTYSNTIEKKFVVTD